MIFKQEIRNCVLCGQNWLLSARSWNKLSIIIAIFNFFAYADRDLLTIVRKSVMLSLMKLFLGLPLHENKPTLTYV